MILAHHLQDTLAFQPGGELLRLVHNTTPGLRRHHVGPPPPNNPLPSCELRSEGGREAHIRSLDASEVHRGREALADLALHLELAGAWRLPAALLGGRVRLSHPWHGVPCVVLTLGEGLGVPQRHRRRLLRLVTLSLVLVGHHRRGTLNLCVGFQPHPARSLNRRRASACATQPRPPSSPPPPLAYCSMLMCAQWGRAPEHCSLRGPKQTPWRRGSRGSRIRFLSWHAAPTTRQPVPQSQH